MSTVRNDLASSTLRNYSFNLNEDLSFANINITHNKKYPPQVSPSKIHKYTLQYDMNRENIMPNQPLLPSAANTQLQNLDDLEFLQQEIRRLEGVIFFVGNTNSKLLIECDQKQKEIAYLKICSQKYKQQVEAQIRKLKEIANDKTNQCQVVAKNAKREKEGLEQQTERLRFNLKTVIEKKNDELFNISRQKDRQIHNAKKELQNTIDEMQVAHKKENDQNKSIITRLNDEIQHLKEKYQKINQEYSRLDEDFQKEKMRIFEENEANLSELKQKYYRNKLLLIETSQQEVRILEESSQLQRDVFLLQFEKMREIIDRVTKENRQLTEQGATNDSTHEQNIKNYENLIQNLKNKLHDLYSSKQQQIEGLKVKVGVLHRQNIKSIEATYISRIHALQDKVKSQNNEIQRLQHVLERELEKNHALGLRLRRKELQNEQELGKIKLMYSNAEEALRLKFQTEKSLIMQQSAHVIKNYEAKASNIKFLEEELRKLRSQLVDKTQQCQEQEDSYHQRVKEWELQREQLTKHTKLLHQTLQENTVQSQRKLQSKNRQIAQLNDRIVKAIRDIPLPDYSSFEKQIQNLKHELSEKVESQKKSKEKSDISEKKCREFQEQFEKIHLQGDMIINQAKAEWVAITQKKIDEIHNFYNSKCESLEKEKQQLKSIKDELQHKTTLLVVQYKQLENTLSQVMGSLKKRSELEQKVVSLGLDINLVKNKQQLFLQ